MSILDFNFVLYLSSRSPFLILIPIFDLPSHPQFHHPPTFSIPSSIWISISIPILDLDFDIDPYPRSSSRSLSSNPLVQKLSWRSSQKVGIRTSLGLVFIVAHNPLYFLFTNSFHTTFDSLIKLAAPTTHNARSLKLNTGLLPADEVSHC
jgi:hypothetical protein